VIYFVCLVFSPGMPILWFIGGLAFSIFFFIEKWAFLRLYRIPPRYGASLAETTASFLPFGVLFHYCIACWTFSAPSIFSYYDPLVARANETDAARSWNLAALEVGEGGVRLGNWSTFHATRGAEHAPNMRDFWEPPQPGAQFDLRAQVSLRVFFFWRRSTPTCAGIPFGYTQPRSCGTTMRLLTIVRASHSTLHKTSPPLSPFVHLCLLPSLNRWSACSSTSCAIRTSLVSLSG